jgi:hypothetical protein
MKMKWLLINCHTNAQIQEEMLKIVKGWDASSVSAAASNIVCVTQ